MITPRQRALDRVRRIVLAALAGNDATVYLFGSCAGGAPRPSSDIDVAIEARAPLPPELLAYLRDQLEESTVPFDVDIVDLSTVTSALRERVRREGIVWKK